MIYSQDVPVIATGSVMLTTVAAQIALSNYKYKAVINNGIYQNCGPDECEKNLKSYVSNLNREGGGKHHQWFKKYNSKNASFFAMCSFILMYQIGKQYQHEDSSFNFTKGFGAFLGSFAIYGLGGIPGNIIRNDYLKKILKACPDSLYLPEIIAKNTSKINRGNIITLGLSAAAAYCWFVIGGDRKSAS